MEVGVHTIHFLVLQPSVCALVLHQICNSSGSLYTSLFLVCEQYLRQYPGDKELLWEVESIGGPNQRSNIASKIQAMGLTGKTLQAGL